MTHAFNLLSSVHDPRVARLLRTTSKVAAGDRRETRHFLKETLSAVTPLELEVVLPSYRHDPGGGAAREKAAQKSVKVDKWLQVGSLGGRADKRSEWIFL